MRNSYLSVLCLLVLMLPLFGKAQSKGAEYQKVIPGKDKVNASIIKPHKISYAKSNYNMIYDLKTVEKGGREVYEINILFGDESQTPDKIYFDINTLEYVGRILDLKDYKIDVAFEDNTFKGSLIPKGDSGYKPVAYNKAYPHNGFEPAIINYYIASLPLKVGYKASIPTFDLNDGSSMVWANIEVVDEEKVKIGGKTYDTWKVVSHGIKQKTIWISKTNGYAIKMKTKGAGSGAWELKEIF